MAKKHLKAMIILVPVKVSGIRLSKLSKAFGKQGPDLLSTLCHSVCNLLILPASTKQYRIEMCRNYIIKLHNGNEHMDYAFTNQQTLKIADTA